MKTDNQEKLFDFLRQQEVSKKTFTVEDMAKSSGLSEGSIKSYLSKVLKDKWVFKTNGRLESRGIMEVSKTEFIEAMTQVKSKRGAKSYAEWRKKLEALVTDGVENGFPVAADLKNMADSITLLAEHEPEVE